MSRTVEEILTDVDNEDIKEELENVLAALKADGVPNEHLAERLESERKKIRNKTVDRILDDPANAHIRPDLLRALEILRSENCHSEEGLVALLKTVCRNIHLRGVSLFFSYKQKHETAAKKIMTELRRLCQNSLRIKCMLQFEDGSSTIHAQVQKTVRASDWFILLLPNRSDNWGWPLFETGIFEGNVRSKKLNKLFILHHQDNHRPDQFKDFRTIEAMPNDPSEIKKFLTRLCLEPDYFPGLGQLRKVDEEFISVAATRINEAIAPPPVRAVRGRLCAGSVKIYFPSVKDVILVNGLDEKEKTKLVPAYSDGNPATEVELQSVVHGLNIELLKTATVVETSREADRIFGWDDFQCLWGDFIGNVTTQYTDVRWLAELAVSMKEASRGGILRDPLQAVFLSATDPPKYYRPVLYAVDNSGDPTTRNNTFCVVFVEDVTGAGVPENAEQPVPGYIQIASSMRHCYRFAWEVVEPFKNVDGKPQVNALRLALTRVMKDYESRGQHHLDTLAPMFGEDSRRVDVLYKILMNTLKSLRNLIENQDDVAIRSLLKEFAPINLEYLSLSSRWFAEQNKELWEKATNGANIG